MEVILVIAVRVIGIGVMLGILITFIWLFVNLLSFLYKCIFPEPPIIYQSRNVYNYQYESIRPRRKRVIALDTEMVGAGARGSISMLARVSMVDHNGCFYDKYVKPIYPVTDYRTCFSGIRPIDLVDAEQYSVVQKEVARIIQDCILVGHDLEKDINILSLTHPAEDIRDTAYCNSFRKLIAQYCIKEQRELSRRRLFANMTHYDSFEMCLHEVQNMNSDKAILDKVMREKQSLKKLAKIILGRDIQQTTHSSAEDAQAAYDLYALTLQLNW